VFGELFKMMAGVSMVHVPYRGIAPALTDLMAGQLQVYFGALTSSIEYIKAGRLRALAVTTAKRSEALPDLPTVGEFVPGYEASQWYGLGVAKTHPPRSSTDSTRKSAWPSPTPILIGSASASSSNAFDSALEPPLS
jgi:tripartite-type tricarboxylate transporter receptor subunit TctC